MADHEFNLETNTACVGRGGTYIGVLYHQLGNQAVPTQIVLPGNKIQKAKEPGAVINLAQIAAKAKLGGEVPTNTLIALSIARLCMRGSHMVGNKTPADTGRVERVVSYAIAKSRKTEALPANMKLFERNYHDRGIGRMQRDKTTGMTPIDPLIHLPFAPPDQKQKYHIDEAVEALANGPTIARQPYIALQRLGNLQLERIVLPNEL